MIVNEKTSTDLKTSDFYYDLPPERIAQTPLEKRDSSKLLVLGKKSGSIEHRTFCDILDYLNPNDVLVINNSKVIPARLMGKKPETDADIEVVLLRQRRTDVWETLTRPGKKTKPGATILFADGKLYATVLETLEGGTRLLQFDYDHKNNLYALFDEIGNMPLPPYIKEKLKDRNRYQTVYAKTEGSAAAPTAGLHFTHELLKKIQEKGIYVAPVMLHVGLGTFRPVKVDQIREHTMHSEYFSISQESADCINNARQKGGRIIAVGTTSCRVLESAADVDGKVHAMSEDTGIFIYPGYRFKAVDALITNFHLPESTLLMLVSAFSSRDHIMNAYQTAIDHQYRFFSFGDAMFIV